MWALQWLELLNSMLKEAEWTRDSYVPKLDEYMSNGFISFALGPIVLPTVYLIGPELSENVVQNGELRSLFKLMSTCGRLLNDIQSFKVHKIVIFCVIKLIRLSCFSCTRRICCQCVACRENRRKVN